MIKALIYWKKVVVEKKMFNVKVLTQNGIWNLVSIQMGTVWLILTWWSAVLLKKSGGSVKKLLVKREGHFGKIRNGNNLNKKSANWKRYAKFQNYQDYEIWIWVLETAMSTSRGMGMNPNTSFSIMTLSIQQFSLETWLILELIKWCNAEVWSKPTKKNYRQTIRMK